MSSNKDKHRRAAISFVLQKYLSSEPIEEKVIEGIALSLKEEAPAVFKILLMRNNLDGKVATVYESADSRELYNEIQNLIKLMDTICQT